VEVAFLVLDDHSLVVGELDKLSHLLDALVRARDEELVLRDEPRLPSALITHQDGMVCINFCSLLLAMDVGQIIAAIIHGPVEGPKSLGSKETGAYCGTRSPISRQYRSSCVSACIFVPS